MNNVIPLRPDPIHEEFRQWYYDPAQCELRKSCAEGWAFLIWKASRETIELVIDWPESNDNTWKEGEEGAYARGHEDGKDKTLLALQRALKESGIKNRVPYGENDLPAS